MIEAGINYVDIAVIDRINKVNGTETIVLGSQQYTQKDGKGKANVFANAFKRDLPNAEIHFVPSGHFALESHHTEIARLMKEFLERVLK